ncbi:MAG TPA: conjugal transfer protein TraN, partial [Burkholderiaceae bacterium]|nr:conjugal transfer protein TraN [Burkholderiaceae bacterium]
TVGTQLAANGLSVGAYGFTYSTVDTTGAGLMDADTALMGNSADGFLMFNPYTLIIAVVIMVVEDLMTCTPQEQELAMHRGASLSVFINETCTINQPIVNQCLEWTDFYCSFNSILAKIINTQGKPQLGLPIAGCAGLTTAQMSEINYSLINFSEFTATMGTIANNNLPASAAINQAYTPAMQATTQGSAQTPTSSVIPSYPTTTTTPP